MTPADPLALSKKHLLWLRASASPPCVMYPGEYWDAAPRAFRYLSSLGLVRCYLPHNPIHKERAIITDKGRDVLVSHGGEHAR